MSKSRFSQSLSGSYRASVIWSYKRLLEIKTEVPARMERHLDFLINGPKPRGRPKGKLQYDDTPYLIEMGRLLETCEAGNVNHAATIVVAQNPALTPPTIEKDSVVRRLSDAFKKDAALYRFLGQQETLTTSGKPAR